MKGLFLITSAFDVSGSNIQSTVINSINSGDVLRISNLGGSKRSHFPLQMIQYQLEMTVFLYK